MFECSLCSRSFKSRTTLNFHTNSHTKERPYECLTCSATFGDPGTLAKHMRVVHDGIRRDLKKKLKCGECSYKCSARSILANHMRKHSAESPLSCNVPGCGFKTKYTTSLPRHVIQVHGDEHPYACQVDGCNYKGKLLDKLQQHLKTHSKERPFKCTFSGCRYTSRRKDGLELHVFKVHTDEKPLKCSTCDFRTKYKLALRVHEDEHSKIKRFRCQAPNCSFASHYSKSLKLHFDGKHKKKIVPCTAPGCNYKCGSILLLQRHINKHMRPTLKCPAGESCNFSTKFPGILRKHVASHHGRDGLHLLAQSGLQNIQRAADVANNPLICSFPGCNYQTEFQHRYDSHIVTHDEIIRKHACKFCSRRFIAPDALRKHIQRHTKEKPYNCSLCDYAAIDFTYLKCHARNTHRVYVKCTDTNELKGFKTCRLCGTSFCSGSEFVLHSMKHLQPVVVLERLHLCVI